MASHKVFQILVYSDLYIIFFLWNRVQIFAFCHMVKENITWISEQVLYSIISFYSKFWPPSAF